MLEDTNKQKSLENWSEFKSGQCFAFEAREVVCKLNFRLGLIQFPWLQSGEDTTAYKYFS